MSDSKPRRSTLVLSRAWVDSASETSFVTRSVAGALSRFTDVTVAVPGLHQKWPDGAFDVVGIGSTTDDRWPSVLASQVPTPDIVLCEAVDPIMPRGQPLFPAAATYVISPGADSDPCPGMLRFTPHPDDPDARFLELLVPVNPLAEGHRHNGLGFTGYALILSDRARTIDPVPPAEVVAWLTAAYHDTYVVVVENAMAAVWKGRALRGVVPVDTRTDFWRLLAHANLTVDLAPGPLIGRECIESLRFGTPIIVPAESTANAHVVAGGGWSYTDMADVLDRVEQGFDPSIRAAVSEKGRAYADKHYGDPDSFVASVKRDFTASP
jgi:hypothetical protein